MNILIIGGLAGVALLALIGAVWLSIGEERAEKALQEQKAQQNAPILLPQQAQSIQQESLPAVEAHSIDPDPTDQHSIDPTDHISGQVTTTHLRAVRLVPLNEKPSLNSADGQLYEMTEALRIMAQRMGEMEQRLSDLTALLERQQRAEVTEIYMPEADLKLLP